jgi:CheY-like chemotaxis protein
MAKRILIVDDDELVLIALKELLKPHGYEVHTLTSGSEALRRLDQEGFDLFVLDIMMPEMDGLTFAKLVRRCVGTPVMFVSIAKQQAEAVLAGAVGYVQKPAMVREVRDAVERVLGKECSNNTILIVEDDQDVRDIYRSFLEPRFLVLDAADGRAALELLRTKPVDLVISDVHMPVMNGVELIRAMRADAALASLPVIVQTADQTAVSAPVWRDLSVAQVVSKTKFLRWLKERIDAHVDGKPGPVELEGSRNIAKR